MTENYYDEAFKRAAKQRCLFCKKKAQWVRMTQFSGAHPFCDGHARAESDFGKEDSSYFHWRKVDRDD